MASRRGNEKPASDECVRVAVRCRPFSTKEKEKSCKLAVSMEPQRNQVTLVDLSGKEMPRDFTFDIVYDQQSQQQTVFEKSALPIVESVMQGFNGTIFAYGQTGTGKTHTMEGKDEPSLRGIIPNSFEYVFDTISSSTGKEFLVRASMLEIYNEDVHDLLGEDSKARLELKEHPDAGFYVKDLRAVVVRSARETDKLMQLGKSNRTVAATLMNQDSSRSHCIFTITVEMGEKGADKQSHIRMGKLNLVDLAGSERTSKSGVTGLHFKEATKINLSLSTLGQVISALVDGSSHVPYRDSKLTKLLEDSLGGNTKTLMIAAIGPADYNYDETLSTLRYANRAKNIKNKPRINEDPKDAMLREFQAEISRLREELEKKGGQGTGGVVLSPEEYATLLKQLEEAQNQHKSQVIGREEDDEELQAEIQAFKEQAERLKAERETIIREAEVERRKLQHELERERAERALMAQKLKAMEDGQKWGLSNRTMLIETPGSGLGGGGGSGSDSSGKLSSSSSGNDGKNSIYNSESSSMTSSLSSAGGARRNLSPARNVSRFQKKKKSLAPSRDGPLANRPSLEASSDIKQRKSSPNVGAISARSNASAPPIGVVGSANNEEQQQQREGTASSFPGDRWSPSLLSNPSSHLDPPRNPSPLKIGFRPTPMQPPPPSSSFPFLIPPPPTDPRRTLSLDLGEETPLKPPAPTPAALNVVKPWNKRLLMPNRPVLVEREIPDSTGTQYLPSDDEEEEYYPGMGPNARAKETRVITEEPKVAWMADEITPRKPPETKVRSMLSHLTLVKTNITPRIKDFKSKKMGR